MPIKKKLSEREIIRRIANLIDTEANVLGHEEDAIAIEQDGNYMVINIDGWVASTDRPEGMSFHDCGYRAVANSISDVLVKRAKPEFMIISLSIPSDLVEYTEDIIQGFSDAGKNFDVNYLGGDLNSSTDIVIDVTVWGYTKNIVRRDTAKEGDLLYWLGPPLGENATALGILTKDWEGDRVRSLEIMGQPSLYPEFLEIDARAAIDCSDGLAITLYLLSRSSRVGIDLETNLPLSSWVEEVARKNDLDPLDLVLYGGEELGIVFSIDPSLDVTDNCVLLGTITDTEEVKIGDRIIDNRGWDHFS